MPKQKLKFSQKHPFLFGFTLIILAVALFAGVTVFLRSLGTGGGVSALTADKIGMVRVEGMIADSEKVTAFIRDLQDDSSIRGAIVRINSPGGVVAPSQEIFQAVRRLAKDKPVIVSMASVAASGGYYIAAGADMIYANPGTLTGSIGVKAELTNFSGLMQKLGVTQELIASGANKGAGSPFRPLTPEQRKYLKAMVMDIHDQFVTDVAEARGLPREKVEAVADGRALTGRQALEAGLVDRLGGLADAVAMLKAKCGIEGRARVVEGPEEDKTGLLRELLSGSLSGVTDARSGLKLMAE